MLLDSVSTTSKHTKHIAKKQQKEILYQTSRILKILSVTDSQPGFPHQELPVYQIHQTEQQYFELSNKKEDFKQLIYIQLATS